MNIASPALDQKTLHICMKFLHRGNSIMKEKGKEKLLVASGEVKQPAVTLEIEELEKIASPVEKSVALDETDSVTQIVYNSKTYSLWNPFSDMNHLIRLRKRGPMTIVKADGPYIYNEKGQKFINAASSLWNVAVGHGREEIVQAVSKQLRVLAYSSCFRQTHPKAMELADKLVDITDGHYTRAFLGSNGSEAIETAIKMTRQYFKQSPKKEERDRFKIISLNNSYHGVTYGAMSTSGDEDYENKYGPLLEGFKQIDPPYCYRCPYGKEGQENCNLECVTKLEEMIIAENPSTCAAFILEPIMGVHGIVNPPEEYYEQIGELCKEYGMLLIADEVTTGFGRTGKLFNSIDWKYRPDILVLGKGISSGYLPLSATMATEKIYKHFNGNDQSFSHGSTASGHPACAAAGLANIDIIIKERLVDNACVLGEYFINKLNKLKDKHTIIGDVRGSGLMIGIELVKDQKTKEPLPQKEVSKILMDCYNMGLYIYIAPNLRTLGLFPPLVITKDIVDSIVDILDKALNVGVKGDL